MNLKTFLLFALVLTVCAVSQSEVSVIFPFQHLITETFHNYYWVSFRLVKAMTSLAEGTTGPREIVAEECIAKRTMKTGLREDAVSFQFFLIDCSKFL